MKSFLSILVTVVLASVSLSFIAIEDPEPEILQEDQVRPIAMVTRFKPQVEALKKEGEKYFIQKPGEPLFSGDTLVTREGGYALVAFTDDNSLAKVKPGSMLIIKGETKADTKNSGRVIELNNGEIKLEIEPIGSGSFEVKTSRSLASVKGTEFGNRADGYVWVNEGQVDVTALNSGQTVSLFERMFANVDPGGNSVQSGTLTDQELNSLNQGYSDVDEDMVEKVIYIRFRDANGQIREVPVTIFEKDN